MYTPHKKFMCTSFEIEQGFANMKKMMNWIWKHEDGENNDQIIYVLNYEFHCVRCDDNKYDTVRFRHYNYPNLRNYLF